MGRSSWDFHAELAKYGPTGHLSNRALTFADAEEYCRYVARTHYENFQIASRLLPRLLRQDFYNLYAYCRWSDDCADEARDRTEAVELLRWWSGQLDALFSGGSLNHPVMCALSRTVERHCLPQKPFTDLLSAFQQDQVRQRYETIDELENYCQRSANPVGRLVLGLGAAADDAENMRLSDLVCTGLQLANFCQDMARDAALGRIYVPRELWQPHRVDETMILAARSTPQLQAMLAQFTEVARAKLLAGGALADRVPRWLALDVRLFRAGGLSILDEITRSGYDVWSRRPTVSKLRKALLLVRCFVSKR